MKIVANNGPSDDGRYLTVQTSRVARSVCRIGGALLLVAGMAGCQYIQFLPFLKRQVNNGPQGQSSTRHGPGYTLGRMQRTTVDSRVDWPAYNNGAGSERFSPLDQITTANVASLRPVCTASLGERATMQSGPIVVDGTMYVTSAINTWAIDAATCALRWRHTYNYYPRPDWDLKTNRGVAYLDMPDGPRLFRGSNDGRVYALDARTGDERWNVKAADVKRGETIPAAPVAWGGLVFVGNAGGDNYGVTGRMMAFDARNGARVWTFDLVPKSGPAALTWPGETDRVPHAGGTTWTSYTIDTIAGLLFVPTGNAAPDFLDEVRPGTNLYTYSVVVLDLRTGALVTNYKLLPTDFHDYDVAAAPVLVTTARGQRLVVAAGKDGHLYAVDRSLSARYATALSNVASSDGHSTASDDANAPMSDSATPFVYRTTTTTIENGEAPLTPEGTRFCPGVQGGTEWNGPAFLRATNMLYVNSVDWCTTVQLGPRSKLKNKLALPWTGSARLMLPFGKNDDPAKGTGWLNAIDADDGTMRWRYHSPTPLVAGVLATAGGLVFTADLRGNVIGFDAQTGDQRFHYNTGQPIGGGVISYGVGGKQYVAVASGLHAPLTWVVKSSKAKVVVFALP